MLSTGSYMNYTAVDVRQLVRYGSSFISSVRPSMLSTCVPVPTSVSVSGRRRFGPRLCCTGARRASRMTTVCGGDEYDDHAEGSLEGSVSAPTFAAVVPSTSTSVEKEEEKGNGVEVELRDVWLSYGGDDILKGVNLCIRAGETVAIIGTSGTGKSTALKLIAGLLMPSRGGVYVRNRRRVHAVNSYRPSTEWFSGVDESNLHEMPNISMVFQNSALLDDLTIGENLALILAHQGGVSVRELEDAVQFWLAQVNLSEAVDKYPEELSGGMKKRASFARAVAFHPKLASEHAPDIILYDEPGAGQDPTSCTIVENIINRLKRFCDTNVIVTHHYSTIRRTADRVVFMHQGKVVWDGAVEQVECTENAYVRQFMSASLTGPLLGDAAIDDDDDKYQQWFDRMANGDGD